MALELINTTSYVAALLRTQLLYRDLRMATVVVKASFEVVDPQPRLLSEQLPVAEEDAATPLGTVDGDIAPIKDGCDLAIFGHAHAPGGRAIAKSTVSVKVGDWTRQLLVFGDRVWTKAGRDFVPSAPKPFVSMPVTYDRAFGGRTSNGSFETAYAANPLGQGYVALAEGVAGTAVPNLEEVDQLLQRWGQEPLPAGLGALPRQSALRLNRGADVDLDEGVTQLRPAFFSFAHPRMALPAYPAGKQIVVRGMTVQRDLSFVLPDPALTVEVNLGNRVTVLPVPVDTVCVFPDYGRFFLIARKAFIYHFVPQRVRTVTLTGGTVRQASAVTTIAELRRAPTPAIAIAPEVADAPIPFDLLLRLNPMTTIVESLPVCPSG